MKKVDINFDEKIKKKRSSYFFSAGEALSFMKPGGLMVGRGGGGGCSDTNDHKTAPLDCAADRRTAEDRGGKVRRRLQLINSN